MFTVFATNGKKAITREFAGFAEAVREFSKMAANPAVSLAALDHDHPEWGCSSLMEYAAGGDVVFHHSAIAEWAY